MFLVRGSEIACRCGCHMTKEYGLNKFSRLPPASILATASIILIFSYSFVSRSLRM